MKNFKFFSSNCLRSTFSSNSKCSQQCLKTTNQNFCIVHFREVDSVELALVNISPRKNKITLPQAQRTQGILKYFDSFNNFISRQTLQQALISWLNLSFVLFVKGRRKHTIHTNPWNKFYKKM